MRGFIEELKYRNVFRVAIAYVIAGWLIAQVADLAADAFHAPEWFMQMLIVLLLLGLPVALFLAWAYELTPEGVRKAKDLPAGAPKDPRAGKRLNTATIVALVVAVAWLSWDKLQGPGAINEVTDTQLWADKSIAVLPFADFSPGGDQGWFADGLTDEILNALARTSDLRVASRTSSFRYRDTDGDLPRIAGELGVAHILEGSVRRAGERLRVTAQLIRADDDTHLWSETFDGTTEDSIEIQENIALKIANALETAMDPDELARMVSAGTSSIEAWELYLRAEALADFDVDDIAETALQRINLLDRAVAIDPEFADAQLAIAEFWNGYLDPTTTLYLRIPVGRAEARRRFNESIAMAEQFARSELSRISYQSLHSYVNVRLADYVAARKRLTELRPDLVDGWLLYGYAQLHTGDYSGSRESLLHAMDMYTAPDETGSAVFSFLHRVDVPAAFEIARAATQQANLSAAVLYQAHRVFLYAGEVEDAARLAALYDQRSTDKTGRIMVSVRQACAEGRVADAEALYAGLDDIPSGGLLANRWLFLKTLGRDDAASEALLPLDTPDGLPTLTGFLNYTAFDPADFPVFNNVLLAQGITRPPATKIPFVCKR